jgi:protein SCO1/2/putative membrane protein
MRRLPAGVVTAALLAACFAGRGGGSDFDSLHVDLGPVPAFRLTDQLGRPVTRDDLLGKVWVANFFFSRCAGDCSKTNATMAKLQHDLAGQKGVLLVGFSVDPEGDTPAVLCSYGERWGNDPKRWLMLTGPEKEMYGLIEHGFKQAVGRNKDAKPGFEVMHTFALVVVDAKGEIRGYVDGRDITVAPRIEERVKELLAGAAVPTERDPESGLRRLLPRVDAALNGTCAVLLVLGYAAVRRRRLRTHKALMLSAFAVSTAFLACYLYYHFGVLHGESTRFGGEGWVRPLYYVILLSHILLAAVVAPLALLVTVLGLTGLLGGHRTLARWTLPLWLYVSVTGVVVYVLLYHVYPPAG